MCCRQNGQLICWSWGRSFHNEYIQLWQLWKNFQNTNQSKKTFRWYLFRQIVPVWNVRQTIYCQKKSIVTSQAPSPAIGHNISLSPLWEEIPRRKQHVFPREVYINTNKQDSYVNFVTSGSRITMHLSDIWKKHDNKKDVCPRCCGLFKDVKQHGLSCKITKTKAHKCGYCDKVFVEKR